MKNIKLGERFVGDGEPCFIIAEAGSNHNGSLERAKQLIDIAVEARADAVKFQVFRADKLYPKSAGTSDYLNLSKSIYDIITEMEIPYEWIPNLFAYCKSKDILFLASAFDEVSVDVLDPYLSAYKLASYEMTHIPFLQYIAKKGKPVIVSTGTADLEEVCEAIQAIRKTGNEQIVLMQCTASYPAPLESMNVRVVETLKKKFSIPTGLSDHSRDPFVASLVAVAIGANIVEKHFTLSNDLPGPDHFFALEPSELKLLVVKIREAEKALGNGVKIAHPVESELRIFARRSIFAVRDITVGEILTMENISVLRCGKLLSGLPPKDFPTVLGKRAARNIRAESAILATDIA